MQKKIFSLLAFVAMLCGVAVAQQSGRYDWTVLDSNNKIVANANVRICAYSAPWSSTTTYSSGATVTYGLGFSRHFYTAVATSTNVTPGTDGGVSWSQTSCTPLASLYNEKALSTSLPNPFLSDANGNFGFWATPGAYLVELSGSTVQTYDYPLTIGGQGFNYRGAWQASTIYNAYDVVTATGTTWEADHTFTSGATFSSANWNQFGGQGFNYRGQWQANTAYNAYDIVTSSGTTYIATTAVAGVATFNPASWSVFASGASVATDAGGALIVGSTGPMTGEQNGDVVATGPSGRSTFGRFCMGTDGAICFTRAGTSAVTLAGTAGLTIPKLTVSTAGSAAAPAITSTTDTTTGTFFPAAAQYGITIAGVNKVLATSTGWTFASDMLLRWNSLSNMTGTGDVHIERLGAASFGFGNGTAGNSTASLKFGTSLVGNGSETAPSYAFGALTNTGFWNDGAGALHVSVAGVRKLRYGSTGEQRAPGFAIQWSSVTTDLSAANVDVQICRAGANTIYVANNGTTCNQTGVIKAGTVDAATFLQNGVPFTGGGGGSSSYPVAIATSGLVAHYDTKQGTGTTLTDVSGHGNDATFATGTNSPTWKTGGTGGVNFFESAGLVGQWVTLPAAINGFRTANFLIGCGPYTSLQQSTHPILLGSSTNPGILLSLNNAGAKMSCTPGISSINSAGTAQTVVTATEDSAVGTHLVSFVCSAAGSDRIYIDGQEVSGYVSQGTCNGLASTSGALQFGSVASNYASANFNGTLYDATFYSSELTAQQIATYYDAITQAAKTRGIALAPTRPKRTVQNLIYCVGDSITQAQSPAVPWCSTTTGGLTGLNDTWTAINAGVGGSYLTDMIAQAEWRDLWQITTGRTVVILWGGTNNINGGDSVARVEQQLQRLAAIWRARGAKVVVLTMLSRSGWDTQKNTYNTWERANWPQFADAICDTASFPELGADGAFANATYFYDTNTHPNATGDGIIAGCVQNTVNAMFGSNESSPAIVSTSTYTEAAADVWVTATSGAAGGTITLPSAKGYHGMARYIRNTSGSAITVAAASGELIDGFTSLTLSNGATLKVVSQVNAASTGGAHWEQR